MKNNFGRKKVIIINRETLRRKILGSIRDACKYIGFKSTGTLSLYLSGERQWPSENSDSILSKWEARYLYPGEKVDTPKEWNQWSQLSEDRFINNLPISYIEGYINGLKKRKVWGPLIPERCLKTARDSLARRHG